MKQAAVIIVQHKDRSVLQVSLNPKHGLAGWVLPGGKIEPGEEGSSAAIRECEEETGVMVGYARWLVDMPGTLPGWEVSVYMAQGWTGVPQQKESQIEVRWAPFIELTKGDFGGFYSRLIDFLLTKV
jgi:8-oxo-dGTP diphosphatase